MSGIHRLIRGWLPAALWMLVIFTGSTDLLSSGNTSRFIGPLLRWFVPDIAPETVRAVQFTVRKGGHLVEYAVLAVLIWHCLRLETRPTPPGWAPRTARMSLLLTALYAATDEWHQGMVASRQGSGWDVLLDTAGAALGLFLLRAWGRRKGWW